MSRSHDHQKHTRVESSEGRKWTSFESTHLRRAVTFIPEDHQDFWELVQQMVMTKTKEECQEQHQKDIAKERKRPSVHLLPAEDSNHCRDEEYKCQGAEVSRTSRITYKCQVCNEGFSQKSNMQLHLRPHTTRRTCKCDNCGRGFNDKSYRCKNVRIYDTKHVIANRVGRSSKPTVI
ncbi:zinc finger protein 58-like [Pecten maximus]|uniref:zinc finger protein 58-like n=1 Tax=Pecten maximus TaxID=6579 RepID=UPI001458766A|nr:zinc finger protein 58-like [Pecten maximus]